MSDYTGIINIDVLTGIKFIPDKTVNCIVTSPPYYGLRDYGVDGQIGLEETPEAYVQNLVEVFREARRVLMDDGTLWLNLGDSYASDYKGSGGSSAKQDSNKGSRYSLTKFNHGVKPKDLIGIPWMVAFALRADGWYLRQDIIWCLSGGTWVYVRTKKGDMPMMIKDLSRLKPSTVKLWNGQKWTQLLGISKSVRKSTEIELVLRSGERISCTPTHKFPTNRGLLQASEIKIGDKLESCILPEPHNVRDCAIDADAAWLVGLYIAEGSKSEDTIQISGHIKETERWERLCKIVKKYGGYISKSVSGNKMDIRIYGKVLSAIIDEFVSGRTAKDKGFTTSVWKYSNLFIESLVDGYLSGDAHIDANRYRIGFCRNYNLERDLRTACARLGYSITLNLSESKCNGKMFKSFRGEIRKFRSGHFNEKDRNEVLEIRKARCRYVYDLGVQDEPHLFALASGVLTHNSKPNPMPESVTDRCTKSHEYIFLLSKSAKYYYDADAIKEPATTFEKRPAGVVRNREYEYNSKENNFPEAYLKKNSFKRTINRSDVNNSHRLNRNDGSPNGFRNKRSVWTVNTKPFKGAHFATFPEALIEPCILAGCPEGGIVCDLFGGAGTTAVVANRLNRKYLLFELNPEYADMAEKRVEKERMKRIDLFNQE